MLTPWWLLPLLLSATARSPSLPQDVPDHDVLQDLGMDIDRIIDDEVVFHEYIQCLLNLGPCTQDTNHFKAFIEEAMGRNCARCSADQKEDAIELLTLVMECRPREYAAIERQYDPSGAFQSQYRISRSAQTKMV